MTTLMTATLALAAVTGILSLLLVVVYVRNHLQLRSPFTLGLALFALFLLFHSATVLYHGITMMAEYTAQAERWVFAESLLALGAVGTLTFATMR
jgi:hypothetical protein